ncbi:MAG: hypothetical protein CW691_02410, partial [Candidatus Bathyarchaeum sp.]
TTDVLLHTVDDSTPLFFETPQKVLPPGNYNITLVLKTSSTAPNRVITIAALNEPENSKIVTKTIDGNDFNAADKWQLFTFNFTVEQPTFIEFTASVTNSANVYFSSMTVAQVSGGK